MSTRTTLRTVAFAAFAGLVGSFAAGCGAAPDGGESTSTSQEAMLPGGSSSSSGGYHNSCRYGGILGNGGGIELTLKQLGCGGKWVEYSGASTGWYVTYCPDYTTVYASCPAAGDYEYMSADRLAWCYANVNPYYTTADDYSDPCTGNDITSIAIEYDPTCSGSACNYHPRPGN